MKKIIRLTENDLTKLVKRVIQEQNKEYEWMANELQKAMTGLDITGSGEKKVLDIIYNNIETQADWDNLKKIFGKRRGTYSFQSEDLIQWLKGDLSTTKFNELMTWIDETIATSKKQDSMYNPGSKIRLITNRQFIVSRAYQYSDINNKNEEELELDIPDSVVMSRTNDGIIVKVPSMQYYTKGVRIRSQKIPEIKYLNNVCLKIKFSDVIEWRDDTLQIQWFSDFVPNRITSCPTTIN